MVPGDVLAAWGWQTAEIALLPGGLVNATYVVRQGGEPIAVIQRLHPVFGAEVNLDIEAVTAHLAARGLITPRLLRTRDGRAWHAHERARVARAQLDRRHDGPRRAGSGLGGGGRHAGRAVSPRGRRPFA